MKTIIILDDGCGLMAFASRKVMMDVIRESFEGMADRKYDDAELEEAIEESYTVTEVTLEE